MKKGNAKAKIYQQKLASQMVKVSDGRMSSTEAALAAKGITDTLIEAGDSLDLKTVAKMAKWVVEQKMKVDNGTLVHMEDGSVYNAETGEYYQK